MQASDNYSANFVCSDHKYVGQLPCPQCAPASPSADELGDKLLKALRGEFGTPEENAHLPELCQLLGAIDDYFGRRSRG